MNLPSKKAYNAAHLKALASYERKIKKLYQRVIEKIALLPIPANKDPFSAIYWRNSPQVVQSINTLVEQLHSQLYAEIGYGIEEEWTRANKYHDELTNYFFRGSLLRIPPAILDRYYAHNAAARMNFLQRARQGLNLSDRVWRCGERFQKEINLTLEIGISEGKSAADIARELKRNLKEPERLYRRVRQILHDPTSPLTLSQAALQYSPGRGVYRSSYKNALRLARNEINFSYEGAARERRLQQDFIVGLRIRVSKNHNPLHDKGGISCLALQGDYPAEFNWTYKWHVNCKCMSFTILKTREEMDEDIQLIIQGGTPTRTSTNLVSQNPKNYTNFLKNNEQMCANWKNKPLTFTLN